MQPSTTTAGSRLARTTDRTFFVFNGVVSAAAVAFLAWLLLVHRGAATGADVSFLPAVNAALNATAACLLTTGWIAIRRGARVVHQYAMVSAFAASSLFLVSYLVYHWLHGDTRYLGPARPLYLLMLASHVLLSMAIVPMCLSSFWFAWQRRFSTHRKVGKVLLPIWLYVSVTGVGIFFLLRLGR